MAWGRDAIDSKGGVSVRCYVGEARKEALVVGLAMAKKENGRRRRWRERGMQI